MSLIKSPPNLQKSLVAAWPIRDQLKREIDLFFSDRGYLSLDTPILVPAPGTEVHLNYFETKWQGYQNEYSTTFLRSSPEIHLKQALASGIPKIYQLAKCFRNGGELGPWHHPEFTMLEWYEIGIDFDDFIVMTEEFLRTTLSRIVSKYAVAYRLPAKINRISVHAAFKKYSGIELIDNDPALALKAINKGLVSINASDDFETAFFKIMLDLVEPELKKMEAVCLHDYPPSAAALARVENGTAKRFEFYLKGIEICNAFLELTDLEENRRRINESQKRREILGKQAIFADDDFYASLGIGIGAGCGNALGFDRWLAIILGDENLDRAIPFRMIQPFTTTN